MVANPVQFSVTNQFFFYFYIFYAIIYSLRKSNCKMDHKSFVMQWKRNVSDAQQNENDSLCSILYWNSNLLLKNLWCWHNLKS